MEELNEILNFVHRNKWLAPVIALLAGVLSWYLFAVIFGLKRATTRRVITPVEENPLPADQRVCEPAGTTTYAVLVPEPRAVILSVTQHIAQGPGGLSGIGVILGAIALGIIGWILIGTVRLDVSEVDSVLNDLSRNGLIRLGIGVFTGMLSWLILRISLQRKQRIVTAKRPDPSHRVCTYDAATREWNPVAPQPNVVILDRDQYVAREVPEEVPFVARATCAIGSILVVLIAWTLLKPSGPERDYVAPVTLDEELKEVLQTMEKIDRGANDDPKFNVQRSPVPGFTIPTDMLRKDSKRLAKVMSQAEKAIQIGDKRRRIVAVNSIRYVSTDGAKITGVYVWYTAGLVDPKDPKALPKEPFSGSVFMAQDPSSWSVNDSKAAYQYYLSETKPLLVKIGSAAGTPPSPRVYSTPAVDLDPARMNPRVVDE